MAEFVREELEKINIEEIIKKECQRYLAVLKDTLIMSLIGHMNEERRILEEKYGSGRVQEAYGEQKVQEVEVDEINVDIEEEKEEEKEEECKNTRQSSS